MSIIRIDVRLIDDVGIVEAHCITECPTTIFDEAKHPGDLVLNLAYTAVAHVVAPWVGAPLPLLSFAVGGPPCTPSE